MPEAYQKIGDSTLLRTWANAPAPSALDDAPDLKYASGWSGNDTPTAQWINQLYLDFGEKINHVLQNGIPLWNATTEYTAGDVSSHTNAVWIALATTTNSAPTTANANWVKLATGDAVTGSFRARGVDFAVTTTNTAVPFNNNLYDSGGSIDHDISTNNTRFTVNRAGTYSFSFLANVLAVIAPTGNCFLYLAKNGTAIPDTATTLRLNTINARANATVHATIPLVANDYIELMGGADTASEYLLDFLAGTGGRPTSPSVIANIKGWA